MKLSPKQKEVVSKMRKGHIIYWLDGLNPHCFLSNDMGYKLSTATTLRLEELSLIERKDRSDTRSPFILTDFGKTISI